MAKKKFKKDENIFEHARKAKSSKKKVKKTSKKEAAPTEETKDEEIGAMLTHAKKWHEELIVSYDGLCDTLGVSRREIEDFLSNPENRRGDWEKYAEQKKEWERRLYEIVGKTKKKKAKKKKVKKAAKERRKKTLGSRKGWIPMK